MSTDAEAVTAPLFAEHEKPTHASCRAVHDAITPTADLVLSVQQQIAEYRKRLTEIQLSEHDTAIDGKLEMLHQTLSAVEREATALYRAVRSLSNATSQWDRIMSSAKEDLAAYQARKDATGKT